MKCRHCKSTLQVKFLDLGFQPPSNSYLKKSDLNRAEVTYPLRLNVCTSCWLVQTEDYANETEFFSSEYAYFSSTSTSWLKHSEEYCEMISQKLDLDQNSFVIEVASNDGYLLKNFVNNSIPCLGIEPTVSTANVAEKVGVPTLQKFFSQELAKQLSGQGKRADLIIGNNVYAHVPDINDFTAGIAQLLKDDGVVTLEFPHLMRMVEGLQFDTAYHEHFSYLSLHTVSIIFKMSGLRIFDVEELNTHGGSLRVYGCITEAKHREKAIVGKLLIEETTRGMQSAAFYQSFQSQAEKIKNDLLYFLLSIKGENKSVAAYGAAAKGNTLLNFAGVKSDLLPFVCDAASAKQGKYLPGSHIPIYAPMQLQTDCLDYLLILPWNISEEVISQNLDLYDKGTQFVTAVPKLNILNKK